MSDAIAPPPARGPIELMLFSYHKRGCTRPALGGDCSCGLDEVTRTLIALCASPQNRVANLNKVTEHHSGCAVYDVTRPELGDCNCGADE